MKINGKEEYDKIDKNDFLALYKQLSLNPTNTVRLIKDRFSNIVKTAELIRDELNSHDLTKSDIYDLIIDTIKQRVKMVLD